MIDCEACGKRHRDIEAVEKCILRAEKRAEREEKRKADEQRRLAHEEAWPAETYIIDQANHGVTFEKIVAALNRDYPIREQGKWTLFEVIYLDSKKLMATWPTDQETITMLRLERMHLGDYVTKHPLDLPLDGSYSMRSA